MSHHNDTLKRSSASVRAAVNAIVRTWHAATDGQREAGARWYPGVETLAHDLATLHSTTPEHVAAVIAHLSPQLQWSRNLAAAVELLATGRKLPGVMSHSFRAASAALESSDPLATLTGPKVSRFARNILGDTEAVTVDVWACRVALPGREDLPLILARKGVYEALEHCYRLAARREGVAPVTMQAATWIVARNGRES